MKLFTEFVFSCSYLHLCQVDLEACARHGIRVMRVPACEKLEQSAELGICQSLLAAAVACGVLLPTYLSPT